MMLDEANERSGIGRDMVAWINARCLESFLIHVRQEAPVASAAERPKRC